MKNFKVLGSGCKKCATTADLIRAKAAEMGVVVEIEKVTDMGAIMGYGVMSTPGVVLNDAVVHSGSVPTANTIEEWIKS
ncbi:thioredoxin family protein [Profundibacter sp.]